MLVKEIKYTDYDGNERAESYYFNLSKAELMEMNLSVSGGLANKLNKMISSLNGPEIMATFKELIVKSYGVKSDDGKRFIKSKEITEEFLQTEAYSELYMELVTDPDKAAAFFNGIIPKDLADEVAKLKETQLSVVK